MFETIVGKRWKGTPETSVIQFTDYLNKSFDGFLFLSIKYFSQIFYFLTFIVMFQNFRFLCLPLYPNICAWEGGGGGASVN